MEHPLVSIIIPTYNRASVISKTIESVLNQTYSNWECIVVDDGSTDSTETVIGNWIQNDARFNYYKRSDLPKGASHCRNIGLKVAQGDFVIFLDSDDILLEFCVEQRVRLAQQNTDKDFYIFPMYVERDRERYLKSIPVSKSYLEDFLGYKLHWGIMSVFWKRDFIVSIGGFNVFYPRLNDPELCIRAFLKSDKFHCVTATSHYLPDTVYIQGEIKNQNAFSVLYKEALSLFIPDIIQQLQANKQLHLQHKLTAYLKLWLNHYSFHAERKINKEVFRIFLNNYLIDKKMYFLLNCFLVLLTIGKIPAGKLRKIITSQL